LLHVYQFLSFKYEPQLSLFSVVMPPELVRDMRVTKIQVPAEASNSEVGFHHNILNVDESKDLFICSF
jgi:hypothetical protein